MKDAFGFPGVVDAERDADAFHLLVAIGRGVGTHQYLVANAQPSMHDLAAPFGWHLVRHWRALVWHRLDLAAKHLLIEFEGRLALAIERQIRVQLHGALLATERLGEGSYWSLAKFLWRRLPARASSHTSVII